ncbi:MAG: metallophosphoesterase [Fidelibacterota bacterium]|nr:MAG: metallophosphoesterase [Candidatus Neomarinimicrobiota bacterium]
MEYLIKRLKRSLMEVFVWFIVLWPILINAQDRVKIALWGDSRENLDSACTQITDLLLHRITDWDFQIHTGDFTSTGSDQDWIRSLNYEGMDSLFLPGKFFMCTSNHDDNQTTYDYYTAGVLPINSADSTTHFFTYHQGNVHIVACDGYFTDASVMESWLDQELSDIPADDWLIGFWHPPCYGDLTYKDDYTHKCGPWLEKFQAHGGDFIFHGHAHVYVRSHPLLPDGQVDEEEGMVHIVNGCGGASWKSPQTVVTKTAFTPDTTSFAVVTFITLEEGNALIQTIDARPDRNLRVIDEWMWQRNPAFIKAEGGYVPASYLYPNFPNPFNSTTTIRFGVAEWGEVILSIHDLEGSLVRILFQGTASAGTHSMEWNGISSDGSIAPSGIYICRMLSDNVTQTRKVILLR